MDPALTLDWKAAKAGLHTFRSTCPGEPEFLAAALEAAHDFITDQEEMELSTAQRLVVVKAVRLEVNKKVATPVGWSYAHPWGARRKPGAS